MAKILIQTTIPYAQDDWHVGRFGLLTELLRKDHEVVARDRDGATDSVLSEIDESDFDELWLIAVDLGDGLNPQECKAISNFRRSGGGLFVTRDHMDLGRSICNLGGVGAAHYFHSVNLPPDEAYRVRDDENEAIDWPNFHSGANGDVQEIEVQGALHPLLKRSDGTAMKYFPAHPHEGAVGAPPDDATARVIARGRSQQTNRPFNLAVAFDSVDANGNAVAQSTFHHICDYNWDVSMGCPSFVGEPPSSRLGEHPELLDDIKQYCVNAARWLADRERPAK